MRCVDRRSKVYWAAAVHRLPRTLRPTGPLRCLCLKLRIPHRILTARPRLHRPCRLQCRSRHRRKTEVASAPSNKHSTRHSVLPRIRVVPLYQVPHSLNLNMGPHLGEHVNTSLSSVHIAVLIPFSSSQSLCRSARRQGRDGRERPKCWRGWSVPLIANSRC
jgi:hypothetical protein